MSNPTHSSELQVQIINTILFSIYKDSIWNIKKISILANIYLFMLIHTA